jgi:hypothetical protein
MQGYPAVLARDTLSELWIHAIPMQEVQEQDQQKSLSPG